MPKPSLLQQRRLQRRLRHFSPRTEEAYLHWVRRFVRYHGLRHPKDLDERAVLAFVAHLASERSLAELRGVPQLIALWLYGSGLRLLECLSLRVKDVDLERGEIRIRRGKGAKDRVTMLPQAVQPALRAHLRAMRQLHDRDLAAGAGAVDLPGGLRRKYPGASRSWAWQWVFPARRRHVDRETGEVRRHHLHERAMQRAMTAAVRRRGIGKRASCHTLRPSFVTALVRDAFVGVRLRHSDGAGASGAS